MTAAFEAMLQSPVAERGAGSPRSTPSRSHAPSRRSSMRFCSLFSRRSLALMRGYLSMAGGRTTACCSSLPCAKNGLSGAMEVFVGWQ